MKIPTLSRSKLIAILTILLLFAFTITNVMSFNVTRASINKSAKNEILPLISDNIYSEIQQILITPINNSSLMANDEFLIDWVHSGENNSDEVVRYLNRIKQKYGYFSSFFVSAQTHNYYYYDGILKQISPEDAHDVWYYRFIEQNSEYQLDVDSDEATQGTITIFINHRLVDHEGKLLGVTGVGLKMDSIGKTLDLYRQRYGHLIYMIDANGLVQVHPDQSMIETVNIKDMPGISTFSTEILSQKTGTNIYEFTSSQNDIILSARYFPDLNWYLIVEQDQTQSLSSARQSLYRNFLIGILVTLLIILLVVGTMNQYYLRLETLAVTDNLTGIYNRRKFEELFQREISYAKRYEQPLSLLMIDIDDFKSINDNYGHQVGDEFLRLFSNTLQANIRDIDILGRWGGEEFVVLLHKTDQEEAFQAAERLRESIFNLKYDTGKGILSKSVSIGTITAYAENLGIDKMIHLADTAMYHAKQEGRNRTCSIQP